MRSLFAACLLALCCAGPLACAHGSEAAAKDGFRLIKADELQQLQAKPDANVVVLDANSPGFRKENGIIPGAKLLSSYEKYDVATELPANKGTPLVFYCTSSHWLASHEAARVAVQAGYTDVAVMSDGLMGWKKAGKPTAAVQ